MSEEQPIETDFGPLHGRRILVTRAPEQATTFSAHLRSLGAVVQEVSLIAFYEVADYSDFDDSLRSLKDYNWIIFASQNSFRFTLKRLEKINLPSSVLGQAKIAVIGPSTRSVVENTGLTVSFQPDQYVAESFLEQFPNYPSLNGLMVLAPQTDIGRVLIVEGLRSAGATVTAPVIYRSGLPENHHELGERLKNMIAQRELDIITFASGQTARNLATILNLALENMQTDPPTDSCAEKLNRYLSDVKIAAIGPVTARACREILGRVDIEATQFTTQGLSDALLASLKNEQKE